MAVIQIPEDRIWFPDPETVTGTPLYPGLIAIGGDLSASRLLAAYRTGLFPWSVNPVTWWSPDPRAIFELNGFRVSRSLQRTLKRERFRVTVNAAFTQVMQGCAEPAASRGQTWIAPEFIDAYSALHREGSAHSVECWDGDKLAGGIYGVAIGGFFAGESMFHRVSDASKVALYHLIQRLNERKFELFDIQMLTPITHQLGAITIPRKNYLTRLRAAVELRRSM